MVSSTKARRPARRSARLGRQLPPLPSLPRSFPSLSHTRPWRDTSTKDIPFARQQDLASLRQCVDYLALGHIHAPYPDTLGEEERLFNPGEWFFNPGCPETWSSEEGQYLWKGAVFVEVDTNQTPNFKAALCNYPHRRPFMRIRQELDACPTPGALLRLLEEKVRREPMPDSPKSPVVEIVLTGVARFSRTEIDTAAIEQLAKEYIDPLLVRVRSTLQEAPASVVEDGSALPREVLERTVFENLIRADDRFAASASDVAQIAVLLKQMVLDGVTANDIANEVHSRLGALRHVGQGNLSATGPKAAELPRNSE